MQRHRVNALRGFKAVQRGSCSCFFSLVRSTSCKLQKWPRRRQLQKTACAEVIKAPIVRRKQWFRIPVSCETHRPYGRRAPVSHEKKLAAFQYRSTREQGAKSTSRTRSGHLSMMHLSYESPFKFRGHASEKYGARWQWALDQRNERGHRCEQ